MAAVLFPPLDMRDKRVTRVKKKEEKKKENHSVNIYVTLSWRYSPVTTPPPPPGRDLALICAQQVASEFLGRRV